METPDESVSAPTQEKDTTKERLFTGYTGRLFIATSAGWLFLRMGRGLLPPLLSTIITDLSITSVEAGFGLTLMWALYAVSQYPSGRFSDQLSRKTLIVTSLLCMIVGFIVLSGTFTYHLFLLGVAIIGIGAGFYPTAARALVSDLFVERRGQAYGIHDAFGSIGTAVAAGLAVVALALAGWRSAFIPVLVGAAVAAVSVHFWSREPYAFRGVDLDLRATGSRLIGNTRTLWLLVAYTLFSFTWQSMASFLPAFLELEKGFSVQLASTGFAMIFIVGALVKPISGWFGDRLGRRTVAIVALVIGGVGLATIVLAGRTALILLGVGIFAAGLMSYPPVMMAYLMDIFPTETMGGDLGAFRTVFIGLASLGPTYVGYVAAVRTYSLAFVGLILCLGVSATIITALVLTD